MAVMYAELCSVQHLPLMWRSGVNLTLTMLYKFILGQGKLIAMSLLVKL